MGFFRKDQERKVQEYGAHMSSICTDPNCWCKDPNQVNKRVEELKRGADEVDRQEGQGSQ